MGEGEGESESEDDDDDDDVDELVMMFVTSPVVLMESRWSDTPDRKPNDDDDLSQDDVDTR